MPFKSEKQRRYMWAKHPEIAARWAKKYGSKAQTSLRSKVKAAQKRKKKR